MNCVEHEPREPVPAALEVPTQHAARSGIHAHHKGRSLTAACFVGAGCWVQGGGGGGSGG